MSMEELIRAVNRAVNRLSPPRQNQRTRPPPKSGIVAYTKKGELLVVYQNIKVWSFPKGHRKKNESSMETAEREFREETSFPDDKEIILDEEKKIPIRDTKGRNVEVNLYLYKMNENEKQLVSPDNNEVKELRWVHINDFENFAKENRVNRTILRFDLSEFTRLTGIRKTRPLNPSAKEYIPLAFRLKPKKKRSIKKMKKRSMKKRSQKTSRKKRSRSQDFKNR